MKKLLRIRSIWTLGLAILMLVAFCGPAWGTALSADKKTEYTDGKMMVLSVAAADTIYAGALTSVNAAGYAIAGADTASTIFVGISREYVDNSLGADGAKTVLVQRAGVFKMLLGTAITIANVGDNVFIADDATVDLTANVTNNIYVGIIANYIDTTHAWVDITRAIQQADVATHIADASAAHAASAISIADAGTFTTQTETEAALQEIYQSLISIQGFVPLKLTDLREVGTMAVGAIAAAGGVLCSDTTPILAPADGATDGGQLVSWAASNNDPVIFQVALPPDIDVTADLILHFRIKSAGTTNAVGFTVDAWFNEGDTKVTDTSETNQTATWAEKIATIAAADVPAGAQILTVSLTPAAHTTDIMYLSGLWIEYKTALKTS